MNHICDWCHSEFSSDWPAAKFCCNAHKQAAYRAKVKAEREKPETLSGAVHIDDRSPVEKAVETKRNEQRFKRCAHCYNEFAVNGLQKGRRYCSDACKQAAYREREANRALWRGDEKQQAPAETLPVTDNVSEIVKQAWSDALED